MKSRIVRDQPDPVGGEPHGSGPPTTANTKSDSRVARIGRWSAQHRRKAVLGWLAFVIFVFMAGNGLGVKNIDTVDTFDGESHKAEVAADDAGLRPTKEVVLVHSDDMTSNDADFQSAVEDVSSRLGKTPYVENITDPLAKGGTVSADGHSALVEFEIAGDDTQTADRVDATIAAVNAADEASTDVQVSQFGDASADKAINKVIQGDLGTAGELSLPITLIILTIALGALLAAGVPLLLGLSAVIGAFGMAALASHIFPADQSQAAVILMIGLAVGVDYSLFYLRREREERAAGHDMESALRIAGATSGRAVLVSGVTVMVAMAGLFISGNQSFVSFGVGTMLVVALAVVASLTVLPAAIAGLGSRIEKGRIPGLRNRGKPKPSRVWTAVIDRVTARPVLSLVAGAGLLVALTIPALGMKTVVSGPDDLDQSIPVIQTYNQVKKQFPDEGVTAAVVVKAADVKSGPTANAITALVAEAKASDTFPAPAQIDYSDDGTVAEISIPLRGSGSDQASEDGLTEVRQTLVPDTVGSVEGVQANVTGGTASSVDFRDQLNERLPLIFTFVFALAFLLLMVTFRSIVIPIKAIILNLLSVGAAYGVLTLVFQDGRFEGLLGYDSNGGVTSWLPLFLFVILFGLSMDYHVFILSRVKELHDRGMGTSEAVRQAISTTAGTVTSAAAVMVGVFAVFGTLDFIDFKEMGIGLAVAVLIDATLVRGVLLPASMELLGDWNWYLPRWLQWLPKPAGEMSPDDEAGQDRPARQPEAKPRVPLGA
jgi:uncharacterized membrane protein YdfJ with MMPL/SSD domain